MSTPTELLSRLNQDYLNVHVAKEDSFWSSKMGLKSAVAGEAERAEVAYKTFTGDASWLPKIREELKAPGISEDTRKGLEGWLRFFQVNSVESAEAKRLQQKIVGLEGDIQRKKVEKTWGYTAHGKFVPAPPEQAGLLLAANPDEEVRKGAWQMGRDIEDFLLSSGFIELVKERNRLARLLGCEDYYDYRVKLYEGFSKKDLFRVLDDLDARTRDRNAASVKEVVAQHGEKARDGWNFRYMTAGSVTAKLDPYFPFETAIGLWGREFHALGIRYRGADLTLDLVSRKGKYENGFMHGPGPSFRDANGFHKARINFTANAVPGQVGSGRAALNTLFHEGGHAAHFSNIDMPAPCFAQEFPPTSVAMAETQSMFLDSYISDPAWLTRYARSRANESIPQPLIDELVTLDSRFEARGLRQMMIVCYFEKALYELPEDRLTPAEVLREARACEERMLQTGTRPVLSVPHIVSGESSASYHAYVLAQMAVAQTRAYFMERDGHLVDNPRVGPDVCAKYWKPGNSRTFFQFVEDLTGKPFSAEAISAKANRDVAQALSDARKEIAGEAKIPRPSGKIELDATIRIIHGDTEVASNRESFDQMSEKFAQWIRSISG